MKIAYLCNGKDECIYGPMCVYREEPWTASDDICRHTLKPEHALNGICTDPENHPERFQVIDLGDHDICFWEKTQKERDEDES